MARDAHEKDYRIYALADLLQKEHKELVEWENLEETFKRANLDQVDHIDEKLRRIGLKMRRATGKPVVFKLSDDQISLLAEMEHGRWNVDRLLDGWTFGKDRDHKKKTRPQLIPWKDLPPEEKEKDFKFIRALPAKLASYGYELYKTDKDVPEDNRTPSL